MLWALVLGFAIYGALHAFVSGRRMAQIMGDERPASLARGLFGAISSSCSDAAAAMSRSVFLRGAHVTAAIAIAIAIACTIAATNPGVELGCLL